MPAPATQLVRSGPDTVDKATGEVVEAFSMVEYIGQLAKPTHVEQQRSLAAAYDAACAQLIGPNDVQKDGERSFKKKSAWKKLARYFTVSTKVVKIEKEFFQEDFLATVTVRATAPWGQSAEAVGACGQDEESGRRRITIADAIATAETRGSNRAISNLIAMGEVTAEEITAGPRFKERTGPPPFAVTAQRPPVATPTATGKRDEEKKMPFGNDKGTPLGECSRDSLLSTLKFCRETDATKFSSLIDSISNVLAGRESGDAPSTVEAHLRWTEQMNVDNEFPAALRDGPDDLPF